MMSILYISLYVLARDFFEIRFCCPDYPGTHLVDQTGLDLTEVHQPLPPKCWDLKGASSPPGLARDS